MIYAYVEIEIRFLDTHGAFLRYEYCTLARLDALYRVCRDVERQIVRNERNYGIARYVKYVAMSNSSYLDNHLRVYGIFLIFLSSDRFLNAHAHAHTYKHRHTQTYTDTQQRAKQQRVSIEIHEANAAEARTESTMRTGFAVLETRSLRRTQFFENIEGCIISDTNYVVVECT